MLTLFQKDFVSGQSDIRLYAISIHFAAWLKSFFMLPVNAFYCIGSNTTNDLVSKK